MPFEFYNYYWIVLILQAICVIHCIRKGTQQKWIWLIVFLPLIGSIAYLFTEVFSSKDIGKVQSGIGSVMFPAAKIKKLEANLQFADTFNNRIELADAYLASGQIDSAIALYEQSIIGTFANHEHANMQLMLAYYEKQRYADVVALAKKIYGLPQFARSRANVKYAISLSYAGNANAAEEEFKKLNGRFSNYEARYEYAMFLVRASRISEAKQILQNILNEGSQMVSYEKKMNREWVSKATEAIRKI